MSMQGVRRMTRSLLGIGFVWGMSGAVLAEPVAWRGELQQGALVRARVAPGTAVALDGKPVRVTAQGEFAVGFGRDAAVEQRLVLIAPDGQRHTQPLTLRSRTYQVQRVEGVPQSTVNPPPEQLERIRQEAERVRKAREVDSDLTDFLGNFIWPAEGRISGVYGSQRFYNGEPRQPHFGVDIAAPKGTPVIAPAGGVVRLTEPDLFFSGGTLIVDHGYGVTSTFIHLDEILVKVGQRVEQGERIARIGATGRATGPHLDWRMNWYEARIDPVTLVPPPVNGRTPARDERYTDEHRSSTTGHNDS